MRSIKFRCWFNGRMCYGIPAIRFDEKGVCRVDLNADDGDFDSTCDTWAKRDDFELMQFTGFQDRNGRDVYDGDIIAKDCYPFYRDDKPNYFATVEWIFGGWQYVLRCVSPGRGISDGINQQLEDCDDFEVVGNIYENPELLNRTGTCTHDQTSKASQETEIGKRLP